MKTYHDGETRWHDSAERMLRVKREYESLTSAEFVRTLPATAQRIAAENELLGALERS